jgi:hypothetical protein
MRLGRAAAPAFIALALHAQMLYLAPGGNDGWSGRLAEPNVSHSVIADPRFVDGGSYNFTLRPDSPALSLGFQPINIHDLGPRP